MVRNQGKNYQLPTVWVSTTLQAVRGDDDNIAYFSKYLTLTYVYLICIEN